MIKNQTPSLPKSSHFSKTLPAFNLIPSYHMAAFSPVSNYDEKKVSCFSDDPLKKTTHCLSMGAHLGAPGMVRMKRKKADLEVSL